MEEIGIYTDLSKVHEEKICAIPIDENFCAAWDKEIIESSNRYKIQQELRKAARVSGVKFHEYGKKLLTDDEIDEWRDENGNSLRDYINA